MRALLILLIVASFFLRLTDHKIYPRLPEAELLTIDGIKIKTSEIYKGGPLILISFNPFDKSSYDLLSDLNEFSAILKEKGIELIAICSDASTTYLKPYIRGRVVDLDVYIDPNRNFCRLMNLPLTTPFILLFDNNLRKISSYYGYTPGTVELINQNINDYLIKQ
jgi:hypothetical protein